VTDKQQLADRWREHNLKKKAKVSQPNTVVIDDYPTGNWHCFRSTRELFYAYTDFTVTGDLYESRPGYTVIMCDDSDFRAVVEYLHEYRCGMQELIDIVTDPGLPLCPKFNAART